MFLDCRHTAIIVCTNFIIIFTQEVMQKLLYILVLLCCTCACVEQQPPAPNTPGYRWTKLLDSAAWEKSYNYQMVNFRDTLWVLHPDGTWFSTDGVQWAKSGLTNVIGNQAFLDYVVFNDALYGLGHFRGNIEKFMFKPEIYRSTDMNSWQTLSRTSNLPHRFFYHPFVFDNKIWIYGGEDGNTAFDDIWNSTDAINWVKQKSRNTPGKRSSSQVVQLNGKLYLLNNDVWTSADGIKWERLTPEILKGVQLFGYTAVVFDNKIWLLGCNRNQQFSSNVLYSADGINWQEMEAPWSPRGAVAACMYKGRLYLTGGKYGGMPNAPDFQYSNDVWVLEKTD
jgi:hypothetical protein